MFGVVRASVFLEDPRESDKRRTLQRSENSVPESRVEVQSIYDREVSAREMVNREFGIGEYCTLAGVPIQGFEPCFELTFRIAQLIFRHSLSVSLNPQAPV